MSAGRVSTGDVLDPPSGFLTLPAFFWRGGASASATVTAVRVFEPSVFSNNRRDLAVLLGAARLTLVDVREEQETQAELNVVPVALRELGPQFFPGKHRLVLDCYAEIASVDEVLTGERGSASQRALVAVHR